jgi:hypothetical protein
MILVASDTGRWQWIQFLFRCGSRQNNRSLGVWFVVEQSENGGGESQAPNTTVRLIPIYQVPATQV